MNGELDELPPEAEARLQRLLEEQRARTRVEDDHRSAKRTLWRTHHWPDEYDRCTTVAGRHVCRRCSVLYPVSLAVLALSFIGLTPWPTSLDLVFLWGLSVPATIDFLGEKLLGWSYSPRRQAVVTALVAVAIGRGFHHELTDRWSAEFWGPVLVFGTIWFLAALNAARARMFAEALERSVEYGPAATVDAGHG